MSFLANYISKKKRRENLNLFNFPDRDFFRETFKWKMIVSDGEWGRRIFFVSNVEWKIFMKSHLRGIQLKFQQKYLEYFMYKSFVISILK